MVNLDQPEVKPAAEVKPTTIIDEVQKAEPFVYTKEEKVEEPVVVNVVPTVTETKQEEFTYTVNTVETKVEDKTEEVVSETTTTTEFTFHTVNSETTDTSMDQTGTESVSREEQIRLAQERIRKLKEITLKMKSPDGLAQLEKETAFARKNIALENKTPSSESQVSRFTLSEGDDKKIEIRPNNSFLHDNVD